MKMHNKIRLLVHGQKQFGSIIGFSGNKECQTINCYYLENTVNGTNEIDKIEGVILKNSEELKILFTELGENFKKDINNINNGYPILVWQSY